MGMRDDPHQIDTAGLASADTDGSGHSPAWSVRCHILGRRPDYSITSSARASTVAGMSRPSAFALRLLRARRERPRNRRGRRAAEQRDELAAPHSRTSLARATNTSDRETPSDAAVLRLTAM